MGAMLLIVEGEKNILLTLKRDRLGAFTFLPIWFASSSWCRCESDLEVTARDKEMADL